MRGAGRRTSWPRFPKPTLGELEQRRPGVRAQGHRRLFRVAEELAVVLPRRRQPGQDQGTKVGGWSNGTSPGQRLRRHRHSGGIRNEQRGLRGRLHDEDHDVHGELPGQQLQQRQPVDDVGPTRSSANATDTSLPAAGQPLPALRAQRRLRALPWNSTLALRYTWDKTKNDVNVDSAVLERRTGGAGVHQYRAEHQYVQRRRRAADVHRGLAGDAGDQPRHEGVLQLAEDEERQHRRHLLPDAERPPAAAPSRTTCGTTRRTMSASMPGGGSARRTGSGSATTGTTSSRTGRTSTTTRRTRSGSSGRTRRSKRCRRGSSTGTASAPATTWKPTRARTAPTRRTSSGTRGSSTSPTSRRIASS